MQQHLVCPGCKRSMQPRRRFERDTKTKKRWVVTYCEYERCKFNIDIEEFDIKSQNAWRDWV